MRRRKGIHAHCVSVADHLDETRRVKIEARAHAFDAAMRVVRNSDSLESALTVLQEFGTEGRMYLDENQLMEETANMSLAELLAYGKNLFGVLDGAE